MADHLVLNRYEGVYSGQTWRMKAGDVVSDTEVPVTALNAYGLQTVPYVAATMATPVLEFKERYGSDEWPEGMAEAFLSAGLSGGAPVLTGIVAPGGVVTGLLGQWYRDTVLGTWWQCTSNPSGTAWNSYRTTAQLASAVAASEGALLVGTDAKANLGGAATVEAALTYLDTADSATAAELASVVPAAEGALLVGTDPKVNLGAAADVEAALTFIDGQDPVKFSSGAGDPNAGAGTAGDAGDYYLRPGVALYRNADGTNFGWLALADQDWVTALVIAGIGWREELLSAAQLIDGAAGGVAAGMILSITGQPSPTDTLTIDDGVAPETFTFVAGAPGAFEVQIGGNVAATEVNLVASLLANSLLWRGLITASLDRYFAGLPAQQVILRRILAGPRTDRVYATLTGAGAIQIVDFVTAGRDDYQPAAATEAAIPAADPGTGHFGLGRALANLLENETHMCAQTDAGYTWESDGQTWNRTLVLGYSQAEINSVVGGAEGALLVGTDAKANLGAAATVEAALTELDTRNPPARSSGAVNPNDGAGTAGAIGDIYVNTVTDQLWVNQNGAVNGWVLTDSDLGSVATLIVLQAGLPVAGQTFQVGADTYTAIAPGVPAAFEFVVAVGDPNTTMANLLAAIVLSGTEYLFWDQIDVTHLRARSADAPQGNIISADPNIVVTWNLANYTCSTVTTESLNLQAGRAAGLKTESSAVLTIGAGHVAVAQARIAFPFNVTEFMVQCRTALGVVFSPVGDTFLIDNGDILITLAGGGGNLAATDIVTVTARA